LLPPTTALLCRNPEDQSTSKLGDEVGKGSRSKKKIKPTKEEETTV
jgi:hypothetical protein